MRYKIGDKVFVKLQKTNIVKSSTADYDITIPFEIIGYDKSQKKYILWIPCYYNLAYSFNISEHHITDFDIDSCYIDERGISIYEDRVFRVEVKDRKIDGMYCKKCNDFYPMAEANQHDQTLICYSCRQNRYC